MRGPYAGPDRSAEASDPARRVACAVWGRREAAARRERPGPEARTTGGVSRGSAERPMAESGLIFGISDMIYCYDLRFPYSRYRVCEICDGRIVIYSRGASSDVRARRTSSQLTTSRTVPQIGFSIRVHPAS